MRFLRVVVVLQFLLFNEANAAGAGRAFPIASENYVIANFKRINSNLEWDATNFLVDLSGQYATCASIGRRGFVRVNRLTQEGLRVAAYVDYGDGNNVDVKSVDGYLKRIIDIWMQERYLENQVRHAVRFGCSVRPGCIDRISVSCLFSPAWDSNPEPQPDPPIPDPKALAFTPEQYIIAEDITGKRWDRSHFLENLSGFETDCAMIGLPIEWQFTKARTEAAKLGSRFLGTYGYEPNQGSTPDALEKILKKMKEVNQVRYVGCSLIPDCIYHGQMYVVVSCIYEEESP